MKSPAQQLTLKTMIVHLLRFVLLRWKGSKINRRVLQEIHKMFALWKRVMRSSQHIVDATVDAIIVVHLEYMKNVEWDRGK